MSIFPDGALPDTRPASARDKDYDAKEIAGVHHTTPFGHKKITRLTATVYSQEFTSSCVPHAFYTQLEYEKLVKPAPKGMSQLLTYRKRANFPNPGTAAVDAYNRIREGQSENNSAPVKKNHREAEANSLPYLKGSPLISDFEYFTINNYASVPSEVSRGKAITIFIYATEAEWSQEYVKIQTPNLSINDAYVRHAVCLVPQGDFKENATLWLTVHDSAAFGGRFLRYMDMDFFMKRGYFAAKVYGKNQGPTPPPPVTALPLVACEFKEQNRNVLNLQGYLIQKGLLESQYQTGYYGNLTAKALLEWQLLNYKQFNYVRPVREILSMDGKFFGPQSINVVTKDV